MAYEALMEMFSEQINQTVEERVKQQVEERVKQQVEERVKQEEERMKQQEKRMKQEEERMKEQMKQMVEQKKVENRIISICTVFENGGTDETARQYLNATEEELKEAHQYLAKKKYTEK